MHKSLAILLALAAAARADEPVDHVAAARELYARGDFTHARDELAAAYAADPRPELLFALGQVEFNLGNYLAAIDYYEKFTATNPSAEQAALAQQAIGAARARLDQPPPPPPPPPPAPPPPVRYHRRWDGLDWGLAGGGAGAVALGLAGLAYADAHSTDRTGTLHDYAGRVHTARIAQIAGASAIGLGVTAAALALVRWRIHLEPDAELSLAATGVSIEVAW